MYAQLEKPEEKKELEGKLDPVNAVEMAFRLWNEYLQKNIEPSYFLDFNNLLDPISDKAKEILLHYEKAIMERPSYFVPILQLPWDYKAYGNLFYTELANFNRTVVGKERDSYQFLGYKMKQGILDITPEKGSVGFEARGGCIINRGRLYSLGHYAQGGFFVNMGDIVYSNLLCCINPIS